MLAAAACSPQPHARPPAPLNHSPSPSITEPPPAPSVPVLVQVNSLPRCSSDEFLLIASDGLFDAVTSEEAVDVTHKLIARAAERGLPRSACAALVPRVLSQLAIARGSLDNVTTMFVDLQCSLPQGQQPAHAVGKPSPMVASTRAAARAASPPHALAASIAAKLAASCCSAAALKLLQQHEAAAAAVAAAAPAAPARIGAAGSLQWHLPAMLLAAQPPQPQRLGQVLSGGRAGSLVDSLPVMALPCKRVLVETAQAAATMQQQPEAGDRKRRAPASPCERSAAQPPPLRMHASVGAQEAAAALLDMATNSCTVA